MNRRTIVLGFIALVNLVATFGLQLYLLRQFGLGGAMDAFFAATTLPQTVLAILIGSAVNVVTPYFSGRPRGDDLAADAWSILFWTFSVLLVIAALIAASASLVTGWLLPGLKPVDQTRAVYLTMIAAAGLPFSALAQVSAAIHQGLGRFIWPGIVGAAMSIVLLAAVVLLAPSGGLAVAAWFISFRAALQAMFLLPGLGPPGLHVRRPALRALLSAIRPLLASTSYFKLAPLLDRWLASFGVSGDISLLHLMQQLFAGAAALFSKAVVEPLVGSLAADRKLGVDLATRARHYRAINRTMGWLIIVAYAAAASAAVLFGGLFVPPHVKHRLLPFVLAFGGLYTAGFLSQLAAAWFYAEGDTRVPARVGALGFSIGIALRLALFPIIGALAIAVAISITQIVNWLMLHRPIARYARQQ